MDSSSIDDTDLRDVIALEQSLLHADGEKLRELLHPAFREYGASGRVWDFDSTLAALTTEIGRLDVSMEDVSSEKLSDDAVLLTYAAVSSQRRTLRSSIWVRVDGLWKVFFHQGTVAN